MSPAPNRLLRPLLWLLWLALLSVVVPALVLAITPLMLLIWLLAMIPILVSEKFRLEMGVTRTGYLLFGLAWPVLIITMIVPALALVAGAALYFYGEIPQDLLQLPALLHRKLSPDLRQLLPAPNLTLQHWAGICIFAGALGFSSHCVYALMEIPWRLEQIRQVLALPRSRARSASMGLAEFEGAARLLPARSEAKKEEMPPFLLEDETGHILVDPRGVVLRERWQTGIALQLNEVEKGIREGDRVYVIGNVQRRNPGSAEEPGSDRLVVRPLRQSLVASPIGRLLFPAPGQPADRNAANIFIVDRGGEHDVALRLRMALWDFCVMTAAYAAASLWLVYAGWQWLD